MGKCRKHGLAHSRIDNIYKNMIARCYKPNNNRYHRYGARGITVCAEWLEDKTNFFKWALENGYKDDLSIDRIDTNGNYEPSNCKWSTAKEQSNNRLNNRYITIEGKTLTMAQWSDITGVKCGTIHARLKYGWDERRAVGL